MLGLSPQKSGNKHFGNWTVFMRWSGFWLCTRGGSRDGWSGKADLQRSWFHPTQLFLSLDLWCKDLVPQKRGKNCFGHWTVFMRWSGVWLCTRDGWLKADLLRSWFHPAQLFLSLDLWCKDLVPQKRGKNCFGHWTVFMRWSGVWLCTRDGWLKADLQRSWFHPAQLFLSLYLWCKDLVPKKRV